MSVAAFSNDPFFIAATQVGLVSYDGQTTLTFTDDNGGNQQVYTNFVLNSNGVITPAYKFSPSLSLGGQSYDKINGSFSTSTTGKGNGTIHSGDKSTDDDPAWDAGGTGREPEPLVAEKAPLY